MQLARWLGCAFSNSLTRSLVHFFPCAGNVTAPYPAQCRLTVFGDGLEKRSVLIDGARFSQPDGVKLDAAFPALLDGLPGPIGVEIELTTAQPKQDLWTSAAVIEILSAGASARFTPRQVSVEEDGLCLSRTGLVKRDAFSLTSLIVVNSGDVEFQPKMTDLYVPSVRPGGVQEIELSETYLKEVAPLECSWGLSRTKGIAVSEPFPPEVAYLLLYRDATTRRPLSVYAL